MSPQFVLIGQRCYHEVRRYEAVPRPRRPARRKGWAETLSRSGRIGQSSSNPQVDWPGTLDAGRVGFVSFVRNVRDGAVSEHRISEAREELATIVNKVAFGGERVRLTRHGKAVAAVVPIEDVELLEDLEDAIDVELALEALAELETEPPVPWEEVKREFGLK